MEEEGGERRTAHGERRTANGEQRTANRERRIENIRRPVSNIQCQANYSYLNASTGSIRAALVAGIIPNTRPIATDTVAAVTALQIGGPL